MRAPLKDKLTLYIPCFNESMVFLLRKLANYNSSNLLNDLFRTSRLVIRGQGVTEDPYSTRLRSKFEFHVSCRLKVGKVLTHRNLGSLFRF